MSDIALPAGYSDFSQEIIDTFKSSHVVPDYTKGVKILGNDGKTSAIIPDDGFINVRAWSEVIKVDGGVIMQANRSRDPICMGFYPVAKGSVVSCTNPNERVNEIRFFPIRCTDAVLPTGYTDFPTHGMPTAYNVVAPDYSKETVLITPTTGRINKTVTEPGFVKVKLQVYDWRSAYLYINNVLVAQLMFTDYSGEATMLYPVLAGDVIGCEAQRSCTSGAWFIPLK